MSYHLPSNERELEIYTQDELPDLAEISIPPKETAKSVEGESPSDCILGACKVCLSLHKKCMTDADIGGKFKLSSNQSRRILRRRRDFAVEKLTQVWDLSVSQLRGHWEDTSNKVHSRKNQLEELTVDNRHFEVKCQEIDAWLNRMEAWQARQRPIGSTKEQLEQQSRDLKVRIVYLKTSALCQNRNCKKVKALLEFAFSYLIFAQLVSEVLMWCLAMKYPRHNNTSFFLGFSFC